MKLVLLAVVLLVIGAVVLCQPADDDGEPVDDSVAIGRLNAEASRFARASGTKVEGRPRVNGRVVPIDVATRKVEEEVYELLPDSVRARTPAEVGTVVRITYKRRVVGEYTDGEDATRIDARVSLVDLRARRRYRAHTIQGPPPDFLVTSEYGHTSGGEPIDEIVSYLTDKYRSYLKRRDAGG